MASLQRARVNKLIIYFTVHKQKAPINKLSRSNAPKRSKFKLTDIREKPVDFFMVPHGRRL